MGVFVHVMFMRGEGCSPIMQDSHVICRFTHKDVSENFENLVNQLRLPLNCLYFSS